MTDKTTTSAGHNGHVFTGVAWPYASGPRHIGHVAGFGVPSDIFSRFERMRGSQVLMISGTDEHGTPILVEADRAGLAPKQLAARYSAVIAADLQALGLSYDLFTRTTTPNHYAVTQQLFLTLLNNGYVLRRTMPGAISPSTGRTLPDRYIEGTCPICSYPDARGDQCENCGNQLDPADLVSSRSRINGERPEFVNSEHFFLDLPAFAETLAGWLQARDGWRSNVLNFSLNLLNNLRPRAISRDLDWGVPIPLDGWRDRPDKRLYVWFDAVIGYLSGSIEWARRTGDPDAWRPWWTGPNTRACYFMGKDNIVFHSVLWPAILLGQNGARNGAGAAGPFGRLQLPSEVVASEFLTMEGQKFSTSRDVAVYVRDFLSRYSADSLRYYLAAAGPERSDTDFTWSEFVRRNNDELVAGWGNLVNRTVSLAFRHFGAVPAAASLQPADQQLLEACRTAFQTVGDLLARHRQRSALAEAMKVVAAANKYLSEQAPWNLRTADRDRMGTQLHVALQAVSDCNTLLTPFIPAAANRVHALLGGTGTWTGMPELRPVEDGTPYTVLMGDYAGQARWSSIPLRPATPLLPPAALFAKLDPQLIEEELARMHASQSCAGNPVRTARPPDGAKAGSAEGGSAETAGPTTVSGPLVIGRILAIEELAGFRKPVRHAQVDVGASEPHGIICTARNFTVGDLVVVALPGTRLPDGTAVSARLTYGVMSRGVLCSPRELGLSDDHSTVVVLPAKPGRAPGQDGRVGAGLPVQAPGGQ